VVRSRRVFLPGINELNALGFVDVVRLPKRHEVRISDRWRSLQSRTQARTVAEQARAARSAPLRRQPVEAPQLTARKESDRGHPARDAQGNIIEPMTLANMRSLGVRNVTARCETCGHEATWTPSPTASRCRTLVSGCGAQTAAPRPSKRGPHWKEHMAHGMWVNAADQYQRCSSAVSRAFQPRTLISTTDHATVMPRGCGGLGIGRRGSEGRGLMFPSAFMRPLCPGCDERRRRLSAVLRAWLL
jgi:hypothetical protein